MNYKGIIDSAVSWVSAPKIIWFVIFFWISFPIMFFLPSMIDDLLLTSGFARWAMILIYDLLYIAIIIGVISLIQHSINRKNNHAGEVSLRKIVGVIGVVITELFRVFVFSISPLLRPFQILFLIATLLSFYSFSIIGDALIFWLFIVCLFGYALFAVYNAVRVFFATTVYCSENKSSIRGAVFESWAMTHGKVKQVMIGFILSLLVAFVLFVFVTIVLGFVSSLILGMFLLHSTALSMGFNIAMAFGLGVAVIAYHFGVSNLFTQLHSHYRTSSSIKRILSRRVLYSKSAVRRSFKSKANLRKKKRK